MKIIVKIIKVIHITLAYIPAAFLFLFVSFIFRAWFPAQTL